MGSFRYSSQKHSEQQRSKTEVNIGSAFQRRTELKDEKALKARHYPARQVS